MFAEILNSFDWKRASVLTDTPVATLRKNTERDLEEVMRQCRLNGRGHTITATYGTNVPTGSFDIESSGRVTGIQVALTLRLIAVRSHSVIHA